MFSNLAFSHYETGLNITTDIEGHRREGNRAWRNVNRVFDGKLNAGYAINSAWLAHTLSLFRSYLRKTIARAIKL